MAKLTEQYAIILGVQSAEGTVNATVRDATAIGTANSGSTGLGLVIVDESMKLEFGRSENDGTPYTGTFSKAFGEFLATETSFEFDFRWKGGGDPTPTIAGEFDLHPAIAELLKGHGLFKGTATGDLTPYVIGTPSFLTFKVWRGARSWTLMDCRVESISTKFVPKDSAVATATITVGSVVNGSVSDTFPVTIAYGTQTTLTPPVLRNAGCAVGAVTRGYIDGTLESKLELDEYPDCNATLGSVFEQVGREFSWKGKFYVDSTDVTQDYDILTSTSQPTEDINFTLGVNSAGTTPAEAVQFIMRNVQWKKQAFAQEAGRIVWDLEGYATHDGAGNDEFLINAV